MSLSRNDGMIYRVCYGIPLLLKAFSISIPHPIVVLAGFSIIVLPTIREGAANLNACQKGKFQGIILHITPTGSNVTILFLASVLTTSSPINILPLSAK